MLALALIAQDVLGLPGLTTSKKYTSFRQPSGRTHHQQNQTTPAQYASILFRKEVHAFLRDNPRRTFVVQWIPGHSKINGNKRANRLANEGLNLRPTAFFNRTSTWAKCRATQRASKTWAKIWADSPHSKTVRKHIPRPLSLKLHPIFNNPGLPCSVSSCLVHVMTGHGWFGEYKDRMPFIKGSHKCPCGEQVQSVPHLLFLCPLSKDSRKNLTDVAPDLNPLTLFGSTKGLEAVAKFIFHSGIGLYK
ncbi:Reverse transcriptase (RNA-dependent DNA polymerase) [Rhizoctonia solani]|uniref:Reverse transcriptase (RNA-dependent DNA polymerase) n=1 Tax=Rhizoctonia solani TaxID=456999 RepID=A0A8H7LXX5_9AGAM|nr:Reverse transcriptase (RNA-dependent DNA polymerase) [Rhizoctonia solani]